MPRTLRGLTPLIASLLMTPALPVMADQFSESGYNDLLARLGMENMPTGAGVIVGQVEVATTQGHYTPNQTLAEFDGKTFIRRSGSTGGNSGHATAVGRNYYGNTLSIAPGIGEIHVFEVNHWIGSGFLRFGQGGSNPPIDMGDVRIFNNSWVSNGSNAQINELTRRLDYAIVDQDLLVTYGMNNSAGSIQWKLLNHAFNGIAVGRKDGNHEFGLTFGGIDGPGRMKPEIVAPRGTTSDATALISAATSLLVETAQTDNGLSNNPNANRSETIKAALLAGSEHRDGWSNNPQTGEFRGITTRPLDVRYGVDVVNVNRSHLILTGMEFDGFNEVPSGGSAPAAAWDLLSIDAGSDVYYRFELLEPKDEVSMLLTWHRQPNASFTGFAMPDLNLELFAVDASGNLISLRGDSGLPYFEQGNIASLSTVDNIEHLYLKNLEAGSYVLRVSREGDGLGAWDAAVAWIMPPDSFLPAPPIDFNVVFGSLISGGLNDLAESDDSFLRVRSQFGFSALEPNIMIINIGFQSPSTDPTVMNLEVESRINNPTGTARVRLRQWSNESLIEIGTYTIGFNELTQEFNGLDPTGFVRAADGRVDVNIKHVVLATFSALGFDTWFDRVGVEVN